MITDTAVEGADARHRRSPDRPLHSLTTLRGPDGRSFVRGLVVITLVAAVVRVMNVLWWRPTTDRPGFLGYVLSGDSTYYHWQANALADGQWFVDPFLWMNRGESAASAAHPPLYSLYLSVWSRLGVDTVTGHRLASSLLGVIAVTLIALLAYRLFGTLAGLVAGAIAAVYPQLWINDGMLLSETVAVLAIAVALHTLYTFWCRPTMRNAAMMGAACGITALARNELILVFPIVVIPLALLARPLDWRARVQLAVVSCVVGALMIAPWAIFNLTRFNEPTLTSSSLGSVISAASCDSVFSGDLIGYYDNCFDGPWPSGELDESERDKVPRDEAIEYIKDNLTRVPLVALARVGRLWGVFKPGQTTMLDWTVEGRGRAPSWIGLFSFYALVPFAVAGFVALHRRRITLLPMLATPIIVTLAAAGTFGVTRYRAPAEVPLVVAAGIGIAWACTASRVRARGAGSSESGQQAGTLTADRVTPSHPNA